MMTEGLSGPLVMSGGDNSGFSSCFLIVLMAMFFGGFGGNGLGRGGEDWGRNEHQHMDTREEIRFNEQATQARVGELSQDLYSRSIFAEICDTDKIIMDASAANLAATADAKFDNALMLKDMVLDNFKCCCETQKAIAASETAILSRLDAFENQNLRDKVQELQLGYSQIQQNQALVQAIRPCPVPSYNTCNPWSGAAYNGGCGTY